MSCRKPVREGDYLVWRDEHREPLALRHVPVTASLMRQPGGRWHGLRCDQCATWPACSARKGATIAASPYCHMPPPAQFTPGASPRPGR